MERHDHNLRRVYNGTVSKGREIGTCKSLKNEVKIFRSRPVRNHVVWYALR